MTVLTRSFICLCLHLRKSNLSFVNAYLRRLAETIFSATQRCNIVPALQLCVALKIVVANRPVKHHLKVEFSLDVFNAPSCLYPLWFIDLFFSPKYSEPIRGEQWQVWILENAVKANSRKLCLRGQLPCWIAQVCEHSQHRAIKNLKTD